MYPHPMIYEQLMRERREEWQRTAAKSRLILQLRPSQYTALQYLAKHLHALFPGENLAKALRLGKNSSFKRVVFSLHKAKEEV